MGYIFHFRARFLFSFAPLCLSTLALGLPVRGAQGPSANDAPSYHFISAKQGHEIASTALQQDDATLHASDCSHLVQEIYQTAGYDYPYASSSDLYAGNDHFRRVRHPQAGDLIAWRGHVGIVVNPKQHSFYSLVRSGLQTEDYFSPYWRSRGTPRFFRFVLDSARFAQTSAATRVVSRDKPEVATISEVEKTARISDKRTASPEPPEPDSSATANETKEDAALRLNSIAIAAERDRPNSDEVLVALTSMLEQTASTLKTDEPLRPSVPVVIYDELKVEKLELKRDKGWAHLKFSSHVRIIGDGPDFKRQQEKVKWEMRHTASGWTAIAPQVPTFISRDAAVRVLSAQLAEMAQTDAAARHDGAFVGQEARIANLIGALLTN